MNSEWSLPDKKSNDIIKGCEFDLLAKSSNQGGTTLEDHLFEAACCALTVSDLSTVNLPAELLNISSFIAGLFHDIGKSAAGFQQMIQTSTTRWPENVGGYRHEMISVAILYFNLSNLEKWKKHELYFEAIFLAIISHHKAYQQINGTPVRKVPESQFFDGYDFEKMYNEITCNHNKIRAMWLRLCKRIKSDRWGKTLFTNGWLPEKLYIPDYSEIKTNADTLNGIIHGYIKGNVSADHVQKNYSERELLVFACIRAFLITGDHLSSGGMQKLIPTPYIGYYNILDVKPRDFQVKLGNTSSSTILIAPTGSGKTEAALYWIANNQASTSGKDGKIFFVLPYSASINAMGNRLHRVLETEVGLVGLVHAKAAEALFSIMEDTYEKRKSTDNITKKQLIQSFSDPWESMKVRSRYIPNFSDLLVLEGERKVRISKKKPMSPAAKQLSRLAKEIFYPVKVTTPHQLLKGVLQGRGWETITTDFYGSCVVFDEIHAYEPHIVGMIFSLIKLLIEEFGAKVLVMSATFPDFLIDKLKKAVPGHFESLIKPDPVNDKNIVDKKRHLIETVEVSLLEYIQNLDFPLLIESNQVLIICNTVGTAQQVYDHICHQIGSEKVVLFHSRFKIVDRNRIEKLVVNHSTNKMKVVVATQVVEVSLDINFDLGICEVAPLDALVQRFGRINRKGAIKPIKTNIWVTMCEDVSSYVYPKNLMEYTFKLLQQKNQKLLSEFDLLDMVNQLYCKHPWSKKDNADYTRALKWYLIDEFPKIKLPASYRYYIDDLIDDKSQVEVILEEDIQKYKRYLQKDYIKASELLVRVRYNRNRPLQIEEDLPPILPTKYYMYDQTCGLKYRT